MHDESLFICRLMKDFPDADNFVKIMNVILVEEDLTSNFNIQELVATTDGFRQ